MRECALLEYLGLFSLTFNLVATNLCFMKLILLRNSAFPTSQALLIEMSAAWWWLLTLPVSKLIRIICYVWRISALILILETHRGWITLKCAHNIQRFWKLVILSYALQLILWVSIHSIRILSYEVEMKESKERSCFTAVVAGTRSNRWQRITKAKNTQAAGRSAPPHCMCVFTLTAWWPRYAERDSTVSYRRPSLSIVTFVEVLNDKLFRFSKVSIVVCHLVRTSFLQ